MIKYQQLAIRTKEVLIQYLQRCFQDVKLGTLSKMLHLQHQLSTGKKNYHTPYHRRRRTNHIPPLEDHYQSRSPLLLRSEKSSPRKSNRIKKLVRVLEKIEQKIRSGYNLDLWLPLKAGLNVAEEKMKEKDELSKSLKKSIHKQKKSFIFPIECPDEDDELKEIEIYELSKSQEEMNVEVESIEEDKLPRIVTQKSGSDISEINFEKLADQQLRYDVEDGGSDEVEGILNKYSPREILSPHIKDHSTGRNDYAQLINALPTPPQK